MEVATRELRAERMTLRYERLGEMEPIRHTFDNT